MKFSILLLELPYLVFSIGHVASSIEVLLRYLLVDDDLGILLLSRVLVMVRHYCQASNLVVLSHLDEVE